MKPMKTTQKLQTEFGTEGRNNTGGDTNLSDTSEMQDEIKEDYTGNSNTFGNARSNNTGRDTYLNFRNATSNRNARSNRKAR